MSCKCQRCHRNYDYDLSVPDYVWETIKPEGKQEGDGLLCPDCIVAILVDLIVRTVRLLEMSEEAYEKTVNRASKMTSELQDRAEKAEKESEALKERLSKSSARNFDMRDRLEQMQKERDVLADTIETMVKMLYAAGLEWVNSYKDMDKKTILALAAHEVAKRGEEV